MTFPQKPSDADATLTLMDSWASSGDKTRPSTTEQSGGYGLGKPLGLYPFSEHFNYIMDMWLKWASYDDAAVDYLVKNSLLYTDNSSSGNDIILTLADTNAPNPTSYEDGMTVRFFSPITNTGACTINIAGIGEKALVEYNGSSCEANAITAGSYYEAVYNATNDEFRIYPTITLMNKLTSKGDILTHDGTGYVKLSAGTDGQTLVSDNTSSSGLKWDNVADPNYQVYCVNSGNVDADGYADLIEKVSDTEVAFKIGGDYPNMGITFPNGKHYEISEIPNVSGLDSAGLYKYCIFESHLAKLENGTYRGLITPVKTMYQYYDNTNILTGFTSNTKDGITVSATHGGSNAYLAVDGNSGTAWQGAGTQKYCGNPYPFVPRNGVPVDYFIDFDTPKLFWKFSIKQSGSWWGFGELYFSGDAGNTWTKACDFSGNNNGTEAAYVFSEFKNMPINKVRVRFNGLGVWHNSGGDCGTMGMQIQSMGLYETATFEGDQITEGFTAPVERQDGDLHVYANQRPLKPVLYIDGQEIEAQFVKIGESTKLDGEMGTPISYAFNGITVLNQLLVQGQSYALNHNIGSTNILYEGIHTKITGSSNTESLPNGSSGMTFDSGGDGNNRTCFTTYDNKIINIRTGTGVVSTLPNKNVNWTGSTAKLYVWRAF